MLSFRKQTPTLAPIFRTQYWEVRFPFLLHVCEIEIRYLHTCLFGSFQSSQSRCSPFSAQFGTALHYMQLLVTVSRSAGLRNSTRNVRVSASHRLQLKSLEKMQCNEKLQNNCKPFEKMVKPKVWIQGSASLWSVFNQESQSLVFSLSTGLLKLWKRQPQTANTYLSVQYTFFSTWIQTFSCSCSCQNLLQTKAQALAQVQSLFWVELNIFSSNICYSRSFPSTICHQSQYLYPFSAQDPYIPPLCFCCCSLLNLLVESRRWNSSICQSGEPVGINSVWNPTPLPFAYR